MSQRTGSNAIPVGTQRPFVSMSGEHSVMDPPSYNTEREKLDQKRRWLTIDEHQKKIGYHAATAPVEVSGRSSKRQSRWVNAADNRAGKLTNLPTMVISRMTNEQLEAFTIDFRIQEISQKLRINDIVPTPGGRSSSPPPQYNAIGHRVNTREQRYRKTLEDERHELIGNAIKVFPGYKTPMDYKPLTSIHEKVYVPVKDFPEINFIGHIIGPRGETLKDMQSKSGSRIVLRGKGSVKGGRGQSRQEERIQLEDDLHCLVIADTHVKVQKAKDLINSIIETAASSPEGQNELKQKQLRRIAEVNGTLRDDENQNCQICGQIGHRRYTCQEKRNFGPKIVCRLCSNADHMERDCVNQKQPSPSLVTGLKHSWDKFDHEYNSLMKELTATDSVASRLQTQPKEGTIPLEGTRVFDSSRGLSPWRQHGAHQVGRLVIPPWRLCD